MSLRFASMSRGRLVVAALLATGACGRGVVSPGDTARCGNGTLEAGEACDDGNTVAGDGCAADCKTVESGFSCREPGAACMSLQSCGDGHLDPGEQCDDHNTRAGDGCDGTCGIEPGFACPLAGEACLLTAACGDGRLAPAEACDDGNTRDGDGCSADCSRVETGFACPVAGRGCVPLDVCGNGLLDGAEACDDGDTDGADGCAGDCTAVDSGWACPVVGAPCVPLDECGNGIVDLGEACDDGDAAGGDGCAADCRSVESGWTCLRPGKPCVREDVCGNGIVDAGEACDDGNAAAGDGCAADCGSVEGGWTCPRAGAACVRALVCGNGLVEGSETCDDGNAVAGDGCSATCQLEPGFVCPTPGAACVLADRCGNGIVEPQDGEACDDGNRWGSDGCSADCTSVESGWTCPTSGGACTRVGVCGNGTVDTGETCDDGNRWGSDGCSADCTAVEDGWTCPSSGGACAPLCGNGTKDPLEGCDDGNRQSLDGCDSSCHVEHGWDCPTAGHACVLLCGNSVVDGDEGCDDGNRDAGDGCDSTCAVEDGWECPPGGGRCNRVCGNGATDGGEDCDLGGRCGNGVDCKVGAACTVGTCTSRNTGAYGVCNPDCTTGPHCGDGVPQYGDGEQCDPGSSPSNAYPPGGWPPNCRATCLYGPYCGDGTLDPEEACDDGNRDDGDGCDSTCVVEDGWECPPGGGRCNRICGNGATDGGEDCDLGGECGDHAACKVGAACTVGVCTSLNTGAYEVCNPDCTTGPHCGDGIPQYGDGEQCDPGSSPSNAYPPGGWPPNCRATCLYGPYCGDGTLDPEEACDDGNRNDGDGCDSTCVVEDGWECPPGGGRCNRICGNGTTDGGEDCDLGGECGDHATCKVGAACTVGTCTSRNTGAYGVCKPDCTTGPHCGDGIPQLPDEQCDAGASPSDAYPPGGWPPNCRANCTYAPHCGDGALQTGEVCDDLTSCVDGTRCSADADCATHGGGACQPRGNDGCTADCKAIEPGWSCRNPGSACTPIPPTCGTSSKQCSDLATACTQDGDCAGIGDQRCLPRLDPGEVCDDGKFCEDGVTPCTVAANCAGIGAGSCTTRDGDGCAADCKAVEPGWDCSVVGKHCVARRCGDGIVATGWEQCDDGNSASGDGCSSACVVEAGYKCETPGQACVPTVCGDGVVEGLEKCDDGKQCGDPAHTACATVAECSAVPGNDGKCQARDGDGCSAACDAIGSGYSCPTPGQLCVPITTTCGDGAVQPGEQCDDGKQCTDKTPCTDASQCTSIGDGTCAPRSTDGCSSTCQLEAGFACPVPGSPCHPITCGDGKREGLEECDDGKSCGDPLHTSCSTVSDCTGVTGNDGKCIARAGDGCDPLCRIEKVFACDPTGACKPVCGDGITLAAAGEQCDDGNRVSGDGCSAACTVESGWTCTNFLIPDPAKITVPIVIRDFIGIGETRPQAQWGGITAIHGDFQVDPYPNPEAGIVQASLDGEGKPALDPTHGRCGSTSTMRACNTNSQCAGVGDGKCHAMGIGSQPGLCSNWTTQCAINGDCGAGTNGTCYFTSVHGQAHFSEWYRDIATPLAPSVRPNINLRTRYDLILNNQGGTPPKYVFDSTAFFPIDGKLGGNYASSGHNFHFTSELRAFFKYRGGETLNFTGDDDVWVFMNGKRAVDIGGIHGATSDSVTLSSTVDPTLGLKTDTRYGIFEGGIYEVVMFQAERHTTQSNYHLELTGFVNTGTAQCAPTCGDGILVGGETCDGAALGGKTCADLGFAGGVLACNASCDGYVTSGCYKCGDGKKNGQEACDGIGFCTASNVDCGVPTEATCTSLGFGEGAGGLGCKADCTYDLAGCDTTSCGNGHIDGTEQCDGTDLGTATCESVGYPEGGVLACNDPPNCTYDTSACFYCGNGVQEGPELCDGSDVGTATCQSLGKGYVKGTLVCNTTCDGYDESGCVQCDSSCQCPTGQACIANRCGGCDSDADCCPGTVCVLGSCVSY